MISSAATHDLSKQSYAIKSPVRSGHVHRRLNPDGMDGCIWPVNYATGSVTGYFSENVLSWMGLVLIDFWSDSSPRNTDFVMCNSMLIYQKRVNLTGKIEDKQGWNWLKFRERRMHVPTRIRPASLKCTSSLIDLAAFGKSDACMNN
jgi:hypothetical protein